MNPLNADPTRTIMLRRRFESEFRKRFNLLKQRINHAFTQPRYVLEDAHYVDQFSQWLTQQIQHVFFSNDWWERFVEEAYRKGVGRAWDESEGIDPSPERARFITRVLRNERSPILNVFCPTGEGGGVDPTCPAHAGKSSGEYSGDNFHNGNKVVDKSGNPLNVFHGTDQEFDEFKDGVLYFSPSAGYSYAWNSPRVVEAEISMKNPFYTDSQSDAEGIGYWPDFVKELKAKGHDGLIYSKPGNILKGATGWGNDYAQYVVFSKDQVRIKNTYSNDDFRIGVQLGDIVSNAVSTERVKFLSQRLKGEIKGVTDATAQSIARSLSDGLMKGKSPIEIARAIRRNVDEIGIARSRAIAQTEVTRAVAEGTLDALEDLGVSTATVAVEWDTTSKQPCPLCVALDGVVFSVKEMRGLLPRHVNCKCVPRPVLSDRKGLRKSESAVRSAVRKSKRLEKGDSRWKAPSISKRRPKV